VPDVRLTKSVSKALNKEGGKFNYTFNVNNLGSLNLGEEGTAFNVIVSDNLPLGVEPTGQYWIEPNGATNGKPQLLSAPLCAFECCCETVAHVVARRYVPAGCSNSSASAEIGCCWTSIFRSCSSSSYACVTHRPCQILVKLNAQADSSFAYLVLLLLLLLLLLLQCARSRALTSAPCAAPWAI
jgi:hypothetical protein